MPGQQPSLFRLPVQSLMYSHLVREISVQHLTVRVTSKVLPVPYLTLSNYRYGSPDRDLPREEATDQEQYEVSEALWVGKR